MHFVVFDKKLHGHGVTTLIEANRWLFLKLSILVVFRLGDSMVKQSPVVFNIVFAATFLW